MARPLIVLDGEEKDEVVAVEGGPSAPLVIDDDSVEFVGSRRLGTASTSASTERRESDDPQPKTKRRRKGAEEAPAMRRGAKLAACLNDVDAAFELTAKERDAFVDLFFAAGKGKVHAWRVAREKESGQVTLWTLVKDALLDEASGLTLRENFLPAAAVSAASFPEHLATRTGEQCVTASVVAYLWRRLVALQAKATFDAAVDDVAAVDEANRKDGGAVGCPVCLDSFEVGGVVCCESDAAFHTICKPCFRQLNIQVATDAGSGVSAVRCPVPGCGAVYAARDVRACVAPYDLMTMDEREREASLQSALGATAAVLRCVCGAVGAVSDADLGDGIVSCPGTGCARVYCAKCGNENHPHSACPPPSDMLKWLKKKTKKCPKCKEAIEKNSGCNHMTCRCGTNFCWLCLGPFPNCHCGHFEHESQRAADRLLQQDVRQNLVAYLSGAHMPFGAHQHAGNNNNNNNPFLMGLMGGGGRGGAHPSAFNPNMGALNHHHQHHHHYHHGRGDDDDEYGNYVPPRWQRDARRRAPPRNARFPGTGHRVSDGGDY